jgi:2,4-dienoyl-CoA reductase-like NADH-dependent reductase (Old Yellow Enzyme family)
LGPGIPDRPEGGYPFSFGSPPEDPTSPDFTEGIEFVRLLLSLDIRLINISAGSPYYNPHIQRPALFPPSDGYQPPEDPLVGVARLLSAARAVKAACPEAIVVGTGFTYLQEYLPHVAQAVLREGWMDFVGLGRLVLSYPELPRDTLSGKDLDRKRICRTFSDCTTGPRKGLVSGCYPLDPYYRDSELARELKVLKGIAK